MTDWRPRYERMIEEAGREANRILMANPFARATLAFTPSTDEKWGEFHILTEADEVPIGAEVVCPIPPSINLHQTCRLIRERSGRLPILGPH